MTKNAFRTWQHELPHGVNDVGWTRREYHALNTQNASYYQHPYNNDGDDGRDDHKRLPDLATRAVSTMPCILITSHTSKTPTTTR